MRPDGDELLYLVEGAIDVALDEPGGGAQVVSLARGQAFVVPRGIWHRVLVREPCRLLFFTAGESKIPPR
jgi:mannose-6-phosphate isomerase-like protein (cupin superfamily)